MLAKYGEVPKTWDSPFPRKAFPKERGREIPIGWISIRLSFILQSNLVCLKQTKKTITLKVIRNVTCL